MEALPDQTRAERGTSPFRGRQRGYAAILVTALLVVTSVVVLLERFDATQYRLQRARDASAVLRSARLALIGHAATYRDFHLTESFGYLPCPDTAGAGTEQTPCGKAGKTAIGLLPYKTLGLGDLRDGEGNCLWYAVSGSFKSNPKTWPFNWDTQGQITVNDAAGRPLAVPNDANGGVAAVIIAPGPALAGQRRDVANGCGAALAKAEAYLENSGDVFINAVLGGDTATAAANDQVVWITSKEIFDAVVKRGDFARYIADGIETIRPELGDQPAAAGNALPSKNPFGKGTDGYNFYEGWRDHFRYLRCATAGCYVDEEGGGHNSVLLFGGRRSDGAPRATTARSPESYFESAQTPNACSAGPAVFDNTSPIGRAKDIAVCLFP